MAALVNCQCVLNVSKRGPGLQGSSAPAGQSLPVWALAVTDRLGPATGAWDGRVGGAAQTKPFLELCLLWQSVRANRLLPRSSDNQTRRTSIRHHHRHPHRRIELCFQQHGGLFSFFLFSKEFIAFTPLQTIPRHAALLWPQPACLFMPPRNASQCVNMDSEKVCTPQHSAQCARTAPP